MYCDIREFLANSSKFFAVTTILQIPKKWFIAAWEDTKSSLPSHPSIICMLPEHCAATFLTRTGSEKVWTFCLTCKRHWMAWSQIPFGLRIGIMKRPRWAILMPSNIDIDEWTWHKVWQSCCFWQLTDHLAVNIWSMRWLPVQKCAVSCHLKWLLCGLSESCLIQVWTQIGGKTQLAGFIMAWIVALCLGVATAAFKYIPNNTLAAITIYGLWGLLEVGHLKFLWKVYIYLHIWAIKYFSCIVCWQSLGCDLSHDKGPQARLFCPLEWIYCTCTWLKMEHLHLPSAMWTTYTVSSCSHFLCTHSGLRGSAEYCHGTRRFQMW